MAENTEIAKLVPQLQSQFETNMNFSGVPQGLLDQIADAFQTIFAVLGSIRPQTSFDYTAWTSAIGHFEDQVSDNANKIIVALQAQSAVH